MPTYEYRCPRGHTFDLFQKMSAEPAASCPECGEASERVISGGAGFLFKGEGFYITDYRSKEYREKAQAEQGDATGAADTAGGGNGATRGDSDTGPAAASDSGGGSATGGGSGRDAAGKDGGSGGTDSGTSRPPDGG